ncbi:gamma-glutamylcyclotransferase family protein [Paraburkholderia metrosideri]|nr:gamma-glutamylcyclotransferase family protein [Paraburkholderia metrosideri]
MQTCSADNQFFYFAYGSNMSTRRIVARLPSAKTIATGFMIGYKLVFDKVSKDGSGKCDCEHTGSVGDRVYGVIFVVLCSERAAFDRFEGVGTGYKPSAVRVDTDAGEMSALTYVATNRQSGLPPYAWYKQHVLVGAHEANLPEDYVRKIEAAIAINDPDLTRTGKDNSASR